MTDIGRELEIMLDVLDEKEWIQDDLFEGPHGLRGDQQSMPAEDVTGVCLAGAYTYAVITGTITENNWQPVSQVILEAASDLFPDRWGVMLSPPTVPFFNDDKNTTVEDIRLVLKTAAEKARLEGK